MVYRVLADGIDIFGSDTESSLLSPSLETELNSAGSLDFTLPPDHPSYDDISLMQTEIDVYEDDELIFFGRPSEVSIDWNKQKKVSCEGALAYLNDAAIRPHKFEGALISDVFKYIIAQYNAQVAQNKQFIVGNITIVDRYVYTEFDYDICLSVLISTCIDSTGGYLFLRKEENGIYIDWLAEVPDVSDQPVQFASNMLDLNQDTKAEDICTVVLPIGGQVDGVNITIAPVNQGSDILEDSDAIAKYGRILKIQQWNDIIDPQALKDKATEWLAKQQEDDVTIETDAAELHYLDGSVGAYRIGQLVNVISGPHGVDKEYPILKMSMNLDSGTKKITLGTPPRKELTELSGITNSAGGGSSSGGGGGGGSNGVTDVLVNGSSVVSEHVARISAVTPQQLADGLALKQDQLTPGAGISIDANNVISATGGGGTDVEANPSEPATDDLNTIKIGETVYDIPSSGGGGNPGVNLIEFYGSSGSKTYTIPNDGLYVIFITVTYQGSYTVTLPNDAVTIYDNDLSKSTRYARYIIAELTKNSVVTITTSVSQWNGSGSGIIQLKNMNVKAVEGYSSTADGTASHILPNDDKLYFVIATCTGRTSEQAIDNTSGGNPQIDNRINVGSITKLHFGLCNGSDSPTYSMYGYDGGIAGVIAYEIQSTDYITREDMEEAIEEAKFNNLTMMSDYYSEDEQVVGRWTDGKPLYQKTYDLGSATAFPNNTWTTIVSNVTIPFDKVIKCEGVQADPAAVSFDIWFDGSSNALKVRSLRDGNESVRHITIQYTKTTDAPGTGPTKGNLIYLPALYSEEEREVGVWTDGKPLYQKTIHFSTRLVLSPGNNSSIMQLSSEMNIISCIASDTDYSYVQNLIQLGKNNGYLDIYNSKNVAIGLCDLTIQYTKTTDQPGSGTWTPEGQLAHHYSTSEKIVGTWIDGSTVYERTIQLTADLTTSDTAWAQVQYNNPVTNMSYLIDCKVLNATSTYLLERFSNNNGVLSAASKQSGTIFRSGTYMTIQYTKSS